MSKSLFVVPVAAALLAVAAFAAVKETAIEVRVTADGKPVPDLSAADFTIKENGKAQKVIGAEFIEAPARPGRPVQGQPVWLYVAVQVTPKEWPRVKEGIQKFIDAELRPEFQVSLGGAPFTADAGELSKILEQGPEGGSGLPALWEISDNQVTLQGRLALSRYMAIVRALSLRPGKKLLVLFRHGLSIEEEVEIGGPGPGISEPRIMRTQRGQPGMTVYKPDEDPARNQLYLQRLRSEAIRNRVTIFVADTSGVQSIAGQGQLGVLELADSTGGRVVYSNDRSAVFQKVSEAASGYYLVRYRPSDARQRGRWRKITVAVNRKGVEVRAPDGYLESKPFKNMSELERSLHLQQALLFDGEKAGFPVRFSYAVFRGSGERPALVYALGTHPRNLKGKNTGKGVELAYTVAVQLVDPTTQQVIAYDERAARQVFRKDAIEAAAADENVMVETASLVESPPGRYRLRALVRDDRTGEVGAVAQELEIPDLAAPLSASTILVTRRGVMGERRPPAQPPLGELLDVGQWRLTPECGHVFRVGDPVFLLYDLYNATDDLLSSPPPLQLALERGGQQVTFQGAGQPVALAGQRKIRYIAALNTQGLDPGTYEVFAGVPAPGGGLAELKASFTLTKAR